MPLSTSAPLQNMALDEFMRWVQTWWPDVSKISPLGFGLPYLFGDGSDGSSTISADTNLNSHQIYQYKTLVINATKTLSVSETSNGLLVLFCYDLLQVDGTISMDGKGAATAVSTSYAASGGGGGADVATGIGGIGGNTIEAGGAAGAGAGGDGGAGNPLSLINKLRFRTDPVIRANFYTSYGACGGMGTGNASSVAKGAGGIIIFAKRVMVSSTGVITADGAVGPAGTGGDSAGHGGGGGGMIYIVTTSYTNEGSVAAAGGAGGVGTGGAGDGGAGGAGPVIQEMIP